MSIYEVCLGLVIIGLLATFFWQRFGRQIKRFLAELKPKTKRPFSLRPKSP